MRILFASLIKYPGRTGSAILSTMATGKPNLVFETLVDERLMVSCQTRFNPSDVEWEKWIRAAALLEQRVGIMRLLVVSAGGHPTRAQLDRLRAQNKSNPLTSVISSSSALRFLASVFTFINPAIRCFSPSELENALLHIGLSGVSQEHARGALERLERQLDG